MQEKNIQLSPDMIEMISVLQEIIPAENWDKLSEEEIIKMALATLIAFSTEEESDDDSCSCGHC